MAFIAIPAAAVESDSGMTFTLFAFMLWMIGMDSAVLMVEGVVTNIIDATGWNRKKVSVGTIMACIILTVPFTANWGWVLFDMVDHYLSTYIVFPVAILECVAVGWVFEA